MLNKDDSSGPGRFIRNLKEGAYDRRISVTHNPFSRAKFFLIISNAPILIYKIASFFGVKTVLRLDGFSYPDLYDNCKYPDVINRDTRTLTYTRMRISQQIQEGLMFADWVVFQSEFSRQMCAKFLFNRVDKYSVIYNGVDTNLFKPIHRDRLAEKGFIVSIHGNLRDTDIVSCAINAFLILLAKLNDKDLKFRVIGKMTPSVESMVRGYLARSTEFSKRAEIIGPVNLSSIAKLLPESSVNLHLTCGDPCPNAVLECLASGVPVICQAYGGQSELVGDAGVIISKNSKYDYGESVSIEASEAILEVYNNREKYREIARARALKNFTIRDMADSYFSVIESNWFGS